MTIQIVKNPKNKITVDQSLVRKAVLTTLKTEGKSQVTLTVKFSDDTELHQLNKTFRHMDAPTDVLAFNQDYLDPETNQLYLGDIVISLEQVQIQAEENHQTTNEVCALLAIHGTLHLLGYDHAQPEEKAIMWEMQDRILKSVLSSTLEYLE